MSQRPRRAALAVLLGCVPLLASCGGSASPAAPTPVVSPSGPSNLVALTPANFEAQVLLNPGVCLVEFYSVYCSHCQRMQPIVERLSTDYAGRVLVGQVNVDEDRTLVARYNVPGWPTFIIMKNGREFSRQVGETTYSTLSAMLNAAIAAPVS